MLTTGDDCLQEHDGQVSLEPFLVLCVCAHRCSHKQTEEISCKEEKYQSVLIVAYF